MGQNTTAGAGGRRGTWSGFALALVAVVIVLGACSGSSDPAADGTTTTAGDGGAKATTTTSDTTTSAGEGEGEGGDGELDGTTFRGSGIEGYEPVADSQLVLTFQDGELSVNGGCNTMSSAYTFEDGTLTWTGVPRSTMMACSDELTAQDAWLTELFTKGVEAELDGTELTLAGDDVTITLEASPDADLAGTTWTLDGSIANEAVSTVPSDVDPPTLTIDEEGTVGVFTGCNSGSSTVEVDGDTLTFDPIALTKMFCEGASGELEGLVTTVLDGEVTFTLDGDTLTITNGETGLIYKAR